MPMRWRLQRLNFLIRLYLFLIVFWPTCLPLFFGKIEKSIGIYWAYGVISSTGSSLDPFGWVWTALYIAINVIPIILLFSSVATKQFTYPGLQIMSIGGTIFICLWGIYRSGKFIGTIFSPAFSIIPIVNNLLFYLSVIYLQNPSF